MLILILLIFLSKINLLIYCTTVNAVIFDNILVLNPSKDLAQLLLYHKLIAELREQRLDALTGLSKEGQSCQSEYPFRCQKNEFMVINAGCRVSDSSGILFCPVQAKKIQRIARPVGIRPQIAKKHNSSSVKNDSSVIYNF